MNLLGLELHPSPRLTDRPQLLPDLGIYYVGNDTLPVLRSHLKTYRVHDLLSLVSQVSSLRASRRTGFEERLKKAGVDTVSTLRDYQLALVVRVILEDEDEGQVRHIKPGLRELVHCCQLTTNVLCSADRLVSATSAGAGWSLIHRFAYQQFPDQEGERFLPRILAIYRKIAPSLCEHFGFSLSQVYQQKYGLNLDELWFLGFGLYSCVNAHPGNTFGPATLCQSKDFKSISPPLANRFLDLVSCTPAEYCSRLGEPNTGEQGFEPYNLNPLINWPLIKLGDQEYVLPLPRYLLYRVSSGVYYELVREDQGRFGGILGRAFEIYVGDILRDLPGVPELLPEQSYEIDGQKNVSCEWMIVDGESAVLIECKTRCLSALAKITGDRERIRADLARQHGVADGIRKLQAVKSAIERGATGLEMLGGVSRVFCLLVTLDDFYLPNGPDIRSIIDEELEARGEGRLTWDVQITDAGGLEWLAALLAKPGVRIADVMKRKVDDVTFREWDWKNFVPEVSEELCGGPVGPWLKIFDDVLEAFTGEMAEQFR
ncbi:MAG: hypothetical protein HYX92_21000 [Chloroflexi bacterium]|nr:hypothetical protein [Chloroflexota bacterium]